MSDDLDGCESFFWYRPTRVVLDQRPLNGCVCVCSARCSYLYQIYEYIQQNSNSNLLRRSGL